MCVLARPAKLGDFERSRGPRSEKRRPLTITEILANLLRRASRIRDDVARSPQRIRLGVDDQFISRGYSRLPRTAALDNASVSDMVGMSIAMVQRYTRFENKRATGKAVLAVLAERKAKNDPVTPNRTRL